MFDWFRRHRIVIEWEGDDNDDDLLSLAKEVNQDAERVLEKSKTLKYRMREDKWN